MTHLLIILGTLFLTLALILPLVKHFTKTPEPDDVQKSQKIFGFLMLAMVVAMIIRFLMDK